MDTNRTFRFIIQKSFEDVEAFIFILSTITTIIIYFTFANDEMVHKMESFPIDSAFYDPNRSSTDSALFIIMSCGLAISIPILFDVIVDVTSGYYNDSLDTSSTSYRDIMERIWMFLLVCIPNTLIIIYWDDRLIPYIFTCLHTQQYIGFLAVVVSVLKKSSPNIYTSSRNCWILANFSLGGIASILGFAEKSNHWSNIVVYIFIAICFISFMAITWIFVKEFTNNITNKITSTKQTITLYHIGNLFITLFPIPFVIAALRNFEFSQYRLSDLIISTICSSMFIMVFSVIPGRIGEYTTQYTLISKLFQL